MLTKSQSSVVSDATEASVSTKVDTKLSGNDEMTLLGQVSVRFLTNCFICSKLLEPRRNKMLKKMLVVGAMSAFAVLAVAAESDARSEATQTIALQDGSIVYVFKSGKMAVEGKMGKAVSTKAGTILKAQDGSDVKMVGNEVAQLDGLLKKGMTTDTQSEPAATGAK